MGTRSITYFLDEDKKPFASLYAQFDGYPTGHGNDIKNILGSKKLVNGYRDPTSEVNGISCAAALLIAELKTGAGNYYLHGPDADEEAYVYKIWPQNGHLYMSVKCIYGDNPELVYSSKIVDFDATFADRVLSGEEIEDHSEEKYTDYEEVQEWPTITHQP